MSSFSEKQKKAKAEKIQKELDRRAAVSENVKKHQETVQHLAEIKGRQLAEEEVNFQKAKEEQKQFNQWVSEQYQKKAAIVRQQRRYQAHLRNQAEQEKLRQKKEAELQRRQDTLRAIQFLRDNKPQPLDDTLGSEVGEEIRRKVIEMQKQQHKHILDKVLQEKINDGEQIRRQLIKNRDLYIMDRVADCEKKKKQKMQVVRKAEKMAWRWVWKTK